MHSTTNPLYNGKLIAFEGIDRAGKSTLISLLPDVLKDCKVPIVASGELRSPLAPVIIEALKKGGSGFLKTFLFAADRAWAYETECIPALKVGGLVLWDRYVDSARVYRAVEFSKGVEHIDLGFVESINSPFINADLTIYVDVSVEVSVQRAQSSQSQEPYNWMFLQKVREEYKKLSTKHNYVEFNGDQDPLDLATSVGNTIKSKFQDLFL